MATTIEGNEATTPAKADKPGNPIVLRDFSMVTALLLIWGYFALASPVFLSPRNLSNLAVELSITAVLAVGMLLIIVCGQIDLSIGSGVGLFGGIAAVLVFEHHWPAGLAMAAAAVGAVIVWLAMGRLIVSQRIPAFIITLAGMLAFKGLHWEVIHDATIPVTVGGSDNLYSLLTTWYLPPAAGWVLSAAVIGAMAAGTLSARRKRQALQLSVDDAETTFSRLFIAAQIIILFTLVCNQYRGIPLPAIILGITSFVVWVISRHTPFGRYLYAIGGNAEAAHVSGIPVQKVVIVAFGIMGLIVALGGFMQTAYAGASTTTTGELLELDAIAACVIGGASLSGGRGTVQGVLFGALIMASLLNGMTLLAVAPEIKYIVRGLVLAAAVWLDVKLSKQ